MVPFLKKHSHTIGILLVVSTILITNLSWGSYLIGWDNLQTDLNPLLGVKRAFYGVWQEYQSMGLLAGMGHAADLVRAFFIVLLSFVLPQWALRFGFHIIMLATGALGMARLLGESTQKKSRLAMFIAGLFYILNFGAIQILFIPFESFTVMYGILPWAVWSFLRVLHVPKKALRAELLRFCAINILLTPQSVSQQLFVVYGFLLGILFLGQLVTARSFTLIKRALVALTIVFAVNVFWLVPQAYFLKTAGSVVTQAKANQVHTDNIFDQNVTKGTVKDFLLMRGFHYDLMRTTETNGLFAVWREHFSRPYIYIPLWILAFFPLVGFFAPSRFRWSFVAVYVFLSVALILDTPPWSWINELLRTNSFFKQVFRSPFTKVTVPYALVASYLSALAVDRIVRLLDNDRIQKLFGASVIALILLVGLPAFQGQYFSPHMRVTIPRQYFDLQAYLQQQEKTRRVALFPEYTYWGWYQMRWGYLGSGFIWYGIEQPVISRTFDVWSLPSESYFWEVKRALESENPKQLEAVLRKYEIRYLVLDSSLIAYGNNPKALQADRTKEMFERSVNIHYVQQWGDLLLYEYINAPSMTNWVGIGKNLPNIGPKVNITNEDSAYLQYGSYITSQNKPYDVYFPFLGFGSQSRVAMQNTHIQKKGSTIIVDQKLEENVPSFITTVPQLGESVGYATSINTSSSLSVSLELVQISGQNMHIEFPQVLVYEPTIQESYVNNYNNLGKVSFAPINSGALLQGDNGAQPNVSYTIPHIPQSMGYMIEVDTKAIKGRKPYFAVLDQTKYQQVIEDRLKSDTAYYIIPPHYQYGVGYIASLYNYSYIGIPVETEIQNIRVYSFPFMALKSIYMASANTIQNGTVQIPKNVEHATYYAYTITLDTDGLKNDKTLILYQSYNEGWEAYILSKPSGSFARTFPWFFGTRLEKHVLVNNWANGWELPVKNSKLRIENLELKNKNLGNSNQHIVIIFWPQYLQFAGLAILVICLLALLSVWRREHGRGSSETV